MCHCRQSSIGNLSKTESVIPGSLVVGLTEAADERGLAGLLVRPQEERPAPVAADPAVVAPRPLVGRTLLPANRTHPVVRTFLLHPGCLPGSEMVPEIVSSVRNRLNAEP